MTNKIKSITSQLTITSLDKKCKYWRLEEPLIFYVGFLGSDEYFVVPEGTITDGATSKIFRFILPAWGRYSRACVLHDYLVKKAEKGEITYKKAAEIFLEALLITSVNPILAQLMYLGVRIYYFYKKLI